MAKQKKAKVTSFLHFKGKAAPPIPPVSIEEIMDVMKPLGVPSEQQILAQMKNSGDPTLAAFAADLEREKRGEKVDMRKYSDL
jgi:hypothetical protein